MTFLLNKRKKLAEFDRVCMITARQSKVLISDGPALRLLYDKLMEDGVSERELWRRIAFAYEIKIALIQSVFDVQKIAGIENKHWVTRCNDENQASPLNDPIALGIALRRASAAFSLIARVRSLWDKLFLYLGEIHAPERFERTEKSKRSRRRAFFSLFAGGVGPLSALDLERYRESVDELETDYRTPEMHGHGAVRQWAFDPIGTWPVDGSARLLAHWGELNSAIGKVFMETSTPALSYDEEEVWLSW